MKRTILILLIAALMAIGAAGAAQAGVEYETIGEVKAYLHTRINMLDSEITFNYAPSIADELITSGGINAIMKNLGVAYFDWKYYEQNRRINIYNVQYRQGYKIERYNTFGWRDRLSEDELITLQRAEKIAEEALKSGPTRLDVELYIHDAICAMTEYKLSDYRPGEEGFTRYDTAVGVLRYGHAECDGYSDAFYLIGKLAGLDVGFMRGEAASGGGHLWNTIRFNNQWYMVDVTWDDMDYDETDTIVSYRYFNVGTDFFKDHVWLEKWAINDMAPAMNWNLFPYSWGENGQNKVGAYYRSVSDAFTYAANMKKSGQSITHVMIDGAKNATEVNSEIPATGYRHTYWTHDMGDYTLLEIYTHDGK